MKNFPNALGIVEDAGFVWVLEVLKCLNVILVFKVGNVLRLWMQCLKVPKCISVAFIMICY